MREGEGGSFFFCHPERVCESKDPDLLTPKFLPRSLE
jgi:hypothetical protein